MSIGHLQTLTQWISVESFSRDAAGVNRMADAVIGTVSGYGLQAERIVGTNGMGDFVLVRAGPDNGREPILVMSHMDTVHPPGTLQKFPIKHDGDLLWGPGAYDMKGGAYCGLTALSQAVQANALNRPVLHLFTPDEEIGSPTSRSVIEDLARKSVAVLVTEPTRVATRVITSRKGIAAFRINIEGRPAHAGTHHQIGRSAIREAALLITEIEAMTDYDRGITTNVGTISGGTAGNVVPQFCSFSVDLRFEQIADEEHGLSKLLALKSSNPDISLTIEKRGGRPTFERSEASLALFELARTICSEQGYVLEEAARAGGGSDGNFTAALGIPTLDGLGVSGDGAHTLKEHMLLSSVEPRIALTKALLETI